MLRKIRITLAIISFVIITLLFLDFTGTIQTWFGWMAKIQFLPAVLALNFGVIAALVVLTLVCGRVYCSIICPLGVFQDIVSHLHKRKNRFHYSHPLTWIRWSILAVFIILMILGFHSIAILIAPYNTYGRIVSNLFLPLYDWCNNLLAYFATRINSYAFYSVDVWIKSLPIFIIASISFIVIVLFSWFGGRIYCNTICPVGTILGFLSKFSFFKIRIDSEKCNKCGLCSKNCKSSCIDFIEHKIDYSRCVSCMNCIEKCHQNAIHYSFNQKNKPAAINNIKSDNYEDKNNLVSENNTSRRKFITTGVLITAATVIKAQTKKIDGGLAMIENKKAPVRQTPITPPGSVSARNLFNHCTGCQLCISVCPNQVLRPSKNLLNLMQPEISYERGYCRPECTRCSEVCPTGAINLITKEEKTSIQIGHAVWSFHDCIVTTDKVHCGNCARHCPNGAIEMIPIDENDPNSLSCPSINTERCIGCGACEYVCPAHPNSAIHVEGHEIHKLV